jgi:hypothetical protein
MPLLGFGTWQITGPTAQEATERPSPPATATSTRP